MLILFPEEEGARQAKILVDLFREENPDADKYLSGFAYNQTASNPVVEALKLLPTTPMLQTRTRSISPSAKSSQSMARSIT